MAPTNDPNTMKVAARLVPNNDIGNNNAYTGGGPNQRFQHKKNLDWQRVAASSKLKTAGHQEHDKT